MNFDLPPWLFWTLWTAVLATIAFLVWKYFPRLQASPSRPNAASKKPLKTIKKPSGLQTDILQEGSGPAAKNLDRLTVHYTARLPSGEEVDSSYERGHAFTFKLGVGAVILGWDETLRGMKVGERRLVTVPADLAYGSKGQNKVPPGSTIIFEIELLSLKS